MAEPTRPAPDPPDAVLDAALLAYAQQRWPDVTDIHDPFVVIDLERELPVAATKAALASAYRAGYRTGMEAALPNVEWRVSIVSQRAGEPQPGRGAWSFCPSLEAARLELADAIAEGWPDPRVESRRRGATDWEPVPDGE